MKTVPKMPFNLGYKFILVGKLWHDHLENYKNKFATYTYQVTA